MLLRTCAFLAVFLTLACSRKRPSEAGYGAPRTGRWLVQLDLGGATLPFQIDIEQGEDGAYIMDLHNGDETIHVEDVELRDDTLLARMPLYDSEFIGILRSADRIEGNWHNYLKGLDYRIPFVAVHGPSPRFAGSKPPTMDLSGQWEVHFKPKDSDPYPAIGLFTQHTSGRTTGTFLTETGDYRYLDGVVSGDSLFLSCFDGTHAFLFKAKADSVGLHGEFRSGSHWRTDWVASRNPSFTLRNPDSLTFLREGYDMIDFQFPDLDGNMVSPKDQKYAGKTILVQIMGSWCPNCVDETKLLNELHSKYRTNGLEVISIAFEKYEDTERSLAALRRFREVLHVSYPILYGGRSSKEEATKKLPFLDHVMSFPTCIIIDHKGVVRRIHTGIYGPSTGAHYTTYKRSLEGFVEKLLQEARSTTTAQR
ncbi:MAG: TlpA family protein disulfide reductase [Flavobacteriales bacterium]|nr:TlpA family protein disulfide reductase [Flavobacteriales bacterium]